MSITTALSNSLNSLTSNPKLIEQVTDGDPFYKSIKTLKGYTNPRVVVETGLNAGVSPDAAIAEEDAANSEDATFLPTYTKLFGALQLKHIDTLTNSDNDEGLVHHTERQMKSLLSRVLRQQCKYFYRDGTGSLGKITAINGSTVTLETPSDARNFQKNDKVEFHTAAAGGALRDSGATLTVVSANEQTGVLTFSAAVSTISGVVVDDHVGLRGSRNKVMPGLTAWLTATPNTFFGVPRANYDPTALCGTVSNQSAETVAYEQARKGINDILKASEWSSKKKVMLVNPDFWSALSADFETLEVHKMPSNFSKGSTGGHDALYWQQAGCEVEVMTSVHVPGKTLYVLDPDPNNISIRFLSHKPGKMVDFIEDAPGVYFTRDGENLKALMYTYCYLEVAAPRMHGLITI